MQRTVSKSGQLQATEKQGYLNAAGESTQQQKESRREFGLKYPGSALLFAG